MSFFDHEVGQTSIAGQTNGIIYSSLKDNIYFGSTTMTGRISGKNVTQDK